MLYNSDWLKPGQTFPPASEVDRITEYDQNATIFDMTEMKAFPELVGKLIGNFDEYINYDIILNYQRLITLKLADMVCGAFPSITAKDDKLTDFIDEIRDTTDFDSKLYSAVIDYSRFGVTVFRLYDSEDFEGGDFTCWDPRQWFPIVRDDGTNRIKEHILAWVQNRGTKEIPYYVLNVQRHPIEGGKYIKETYRMDSDGKTIKGIIKRETVDTGDMPCLIQYSANIPTSTNIYGTSDYKIISTIVARATERIHQILRILNVHADPSMVGPDSLLEEDENGNLVLKIRQFYAIGGDEIEPKYLTWDGQLESAFKALEFLMNQLYILSEMGDAFLGTTDKTGQAISGTAMRYKMASPLVKARRVNNSLTLPVKKLISVLLKLSNKTVKYQDISIKWEDSLPKDPREQAELMRLQTGEAAIMPLKVVLMEQFDMSSEDADEWIKQIDDRKPEGVEEPNPNKKGSDQSLTKGTEGATGTSNTKTGGANRE